MDGGEQPRQRRRSRRTADVDILYVNEHPPESVGPAHPGRELGWPYCNPDGGPAHLPFIRDVETNADGSALDCAALPPVEQSLGAHSAPLGLASPRWLPEPYGTGASSASTVRGTASRRVRPKCRSSPGATAPWRSADPCRRFPGQRRLPLGPAGGRGSRAGRCGLHHRRRRRRDLPAGPAGPLNRTSKAPRAERDSAGSKSCPNL